MANDRFTEVAGAIAESAPLQTPASRAAEGARGSPFRSAGVASESQFGTADVPRGQALDPAAEQREAWTERDTGRFDIDTGGGVGEESMFVAREPVHVAVDGNGRAGGSSSRGRGGDVAEGKIRKHHHHGSLAASSSSSYSSSSASSSSSSTIGSVDGTTHRTAPTPPLADATTGQPKRKSRKKPRGGAGGGRSTESWREDQEEVVLLPTLDEARRAFEAQQEQQQQEQKSMLVISDENAASPQNNVLPGSSASPRGEREEGEVVRPLKHSSSTGAAVAAAPATTAAETPPDPVELGVSFVGDVAEPSPENFLPSREAGSADYVSFKDEATSPPPPQPACPPPVAAADGRERSTRCNEAEASATETTEEALPGELEVEGGFRGVPLAPASPGRRAAHTHAHGSGGGGAGGTVRPAGVAAAAGGAMGGDDEQPPHARFDIFDGGVGLEGTTAVAPSPAEGLPQDLVELVDFTTFGSSNVIRGDRRDRTGGGTGSGSSSGGGPFTLSHSVVVGPASAYAQALHMALAFVVVVLVAFAKSGDGAIASYGGAARGCNGCDHGSARRPGGGGKQRRRSASGIGCSSVKSSPFVRRLRAAWSKLWHLVEDDLATRWRAAGEALASVRQAWAALWVPRPHAEAEVLAEALASPPRYSGADEDRRRRAAGGRAGGRSERRRRGSRHSSRGGGALGPAESPDEKGCLRRPVGLNCLNFLSLCGYRPLARAGGGRGSRSPKFLLLLDLDETLVHCSPHLMDPARRQSGGGAVRPDLKLEMRGGAPSDRPASMYAWKRPHLDVFLGVVSRWYELAVFTSSRQSFAEVREVVVS